MEQLLPPNEWVEENKSHTPPFANARVYGVFLVSVIMLACCNTQSSFSQYANALKVQGNFTQSQTNLIISIAKFGLDIYAPMALLMTKYGMRRMLALSLVLQTGGYTLMWASTSHRIPHSNISLAIFLFVVGQGQILFYLAPLTVSVYNFEEKHHGKIIGLVEVMFGLSPAIFNAIYGGQFQKGRPPEKQNVANFFLFMGILLGIVSLLGIIFLRKIPRQFGGQEDHNSGQVTFKKSESKISWTFPLKDPTFYLLFIVYAMAQGFSLMYMNNIVSQLLAVHLGSKQNLHTIISPIFNAVGRLFMGITADLTRTYFHPMYFYLGTTSTLIILTVLLLIDVTSSSILLLSTIMVGFTSGASAALTALTVSKVYPLEIYPITWGHFFIGEALFQLVYQTFSGNIYDSHTIPGTKSCFGDQCYKLTYIISLVMFVFCFCFVLILLRILRRKKMHALSIVSTQKENEISAFTKNVSL